MAISYDNSTIDNDGDSDAMLSEINTTPLVDVMLVLLIIFLITVPVINTSVVVRLPKQANQLQQTQANKASKGKSRKIIRMREEREANRLCVFVRVKIRKVCPD